MKQFVDCAKCLWHPFDELRNLPDLMIRSLFKNLTESPHQLAKDRCIFFKKWSGRAANLQVQETELHSAMPLHVGKIMEGKRIMLMEELANEMGWPDKNLFKEMREGFKLVGNFEATGIFKPGVTVANLSEDELKKNTKFLRPAILGRLKNFEDDDLQGQLFSATMDESMDKHWLGGPYDVDDMRNLMGNDWLPVRRFWNRTKWEIAADRQLQRVHDQSHFQQCGESGT